MGVTLESLQLLQQVELKLTALRSKINEKKRLATLHQKKVAQLEREATLKHETIQQRRVAQGQLELEAKTHEAHIDKLREALNKAKTNKEYAAILTQINTDKADNSKLEDRILQMMTELDELKKQEQQIKDQLHKEQQALTHATSAVQMFVDSCQEELIALEQQRSQAASSVPRDALVVFDRVAERHEGEALSVVRQPNPKRQEFICDGCNMGVTLEQFVSLQSRDDVQLCYNCGRILVLENQNITL